MELPETIRSQGQDVLNRFPTAAVEAYHMDNVIHAVRPNEYTRQHEHVTHAGVQPVPTLLVVPMPSSRSCLRMTTSTCWLCGTM